MTKRAHSPVIKAAALAAGLGIGLVSYPVFAAPASGGETVRGLYDALLNTMRNARVLSQSGRFTQLAPVIRRSFDIASMARLSIGSSWAGLRESQRQQITESFGRYISAIYADRFDSYAGQKLQVTGEQPAAADHQQAAGCQPVHAQFHGQHFHRRAGRPGERGRLRRHRRHPDFLRRGQRLDSQPGICGVRRRTYAHRYNR